VTCDLIRFYNIMAIAGACAAAIAIAFLIAMLIVTRIK
jgi:hypothetical protein